MNGPLSSFAGPIRNLAPARPAGENKRVCILREHVHLPDRAAVADADDLIRRFGDYAASEAARRANCSRSLGNLVHYCRWRQIERMIERLSAGSAGETRH